MEFSQSALGRLPAEIRNTIYETVLTYRHGIRCDSSSWLPMDDSTSISQALSIMSTCKQVRKETGLLLFTLNDITSFEGPHRYFSALRSIYKPISMETVSLLNSIPPRLLSPSSRLITWIPPDITTDILALHLSKARNIQHFQPRLGVMMGGHRWSGRSGENGSHDQTDNFHNTPICSKDAPASMNDCAHVRLVFPLNDLRTALALVEDRYQEKVALVGKHRSHRICPIRVELHNLLMGHEQVRQELVGLVERVYVHL